jgi:hypothetical protein
MKRLRNFLAAAAVALALLPAAATAQGDETVAQAFAHALPTVPGKGVQGVVVEYPPGGK